MANRLTDKLTIKYPIIQAGMAGGITTPELVAAVSDAGGLGTIGAGYLEGEALRALIKRVRALTDRPFAVNVFAADLEVSAAREEVMQMQHFLNRYRHELGLKERDESVQTTDTLWEKIQVILEENVPVVSTAFGLLSLETIKTLKQHEKVLIGMATNAEEAVWLEEAGYDVVVAQGTEAGGHRGTFDVARFPSGCNMDLLPLLEEVLQNVSLPVVAAGGITSRQQMVQLQTRGVSGIQLGTCFLLSKEAGTNAAYRQALLKATGKDTVLTRAFSGRTGRAIENRFITEIEASAVPIPPFPVQNAMTKDIRTEAAKQGNPAYLSLWAGTGTGELTKEETANNIMQRFL